MEETFGAAVRRLRIGAHLSQEALAERSGLSARTVRDIELGKIRLPRGTSMRLLAQALDVSGEEAARFEDAACAAYWRRRSPDLGPSSLPAAPLLVSRERELAEVTATVTAQLWSGGLKSVVVAGMAGVGKTALAVHAAHEVRESFPDGRLFVDLHGVAHEPADPAVVLARLLRLLGVPDARVPQGLDQRAEAFRSEVADRRVLLVLDDAADERQVRPLLPAGAGCAVLVTSRSGLPALDVASRVDLGLLAPAGSLRLLGRLVGDDRVQAEPTAAEAIVGACAGLPLAVRITGARSASRPDVTLGTAAERLLDTTRRLDELALGDLAVRASLELSLATLADGDRRLLGRLAVLDAPPAPAWVAAALVDEDVVAAERRLECLVDRHLVQVMGEDALGQIRYGLHDLVRLVARETVVGDDPDGVRAALVEVCRGWLTLAGIALGALPHRPWVHLATPERGTVDPCAAAAAAATPGAWFDAERGSLLAAVCTAAVNAPSDLAWNLLSAWAPHLQQHLLVDDLAQAADVALRACLTDGDRRGEATVMLALGMLAQARRDYVGARAALISAATLFAEDGERRGAGLALSRLGYRASLAGDLAEAAECYERSAAALAAAGDDTARAAVLLEFGLLRRDQGRREESLALVQQSLDLSRRTDDRYGAAKALQALDAVLDDAGR